MRIERIDLYWARVPLAFVWKTSYGDQHFTDTILVRMEGGGISAWGETCPPAIPGYSAEHTLGTFHTMREHLAPLHHRRRRSDSAQDLLDRIAFVKGNQFARAGLEIAWWVLDAKRRGVPLHVALGGAADRVAVGADFGVQDSIDILLARRCRGRSTRASRGSSSSSGPDGTCPWWTRSGPRSRASPSTSTATPRTRAADSDLFREARPLSARHDRAAPRRRRDEPRQPRGPAAGDRDPDLPRRERAQPGPRPGGDPAGELQGRQCQGGPRRRALGLARHPGALRRARHPVLDRRDARDRRRGRHLRGAGHAAELHVRGRHLPVVVLLRQRPRQAGDRAERSRRGPDVRGAGHRAGARPRALAAVDGGAREVSRWCPPTWRTWRR